MEPGPQQPKEKIKILIDETISYLQKNKNEFGFDVVDYYEHSIGRFTPKNRAIQVFFNDPEFGRVTTSVFLKLEGNEDELIFSEMTTLPFKAVGKKYGERAVKAILKFLKTKKESFINVKATQVQSRPLSFWNRLGFDKLVNSVEQNYELNWDKVE